jgi:hypothetical protein
VRRREGQDPGFGAVGRPEDGEEARLARSVAISATFYNLQSQSQTTGVNLGQANWQALRAPTVDL